MALRGVYYFTGSKVDSEVESRSEVLNIRLIEIHLKWINMYISSIHVGTVLVESRHGSFPSFPTRKSWEPLQLAREWVLLLPANLVRITNSEENYTYDEQGALLKRFSKMLKITYWTCTLQDLSRPCGSSSRLLGTVPRQVCNVPGDGFWTK